MMMVEYDEKGQKKWKRKQFLRHEITYLNDDRFAKIADVLM